MDTKSVIHAYGSFLEGYSFTKASSFPEEFAQKRFLKKMERPDESRTRVLADKAWDEWIEFDQNLKMPHLLPSRWYKARLFIHEVMRNFDYSFAPEFTSGSEYSPTKGQNSLEAKLSASKWDCTPGCFDHFLRVARWHHGLKKSVKMRFKAYCRKKLLPEKAVNIRLFQIANGLFSGNRKAIANWIFERKLEKVVNFTQGSRFSTVYKNREKRRPINVEAFCNMVVQRGIGVELRRILKEHCAIDLLVGQETHARLISDPSKATIDLSNASDSVQLSLVRFLFPQKFVSLIEETRSPFILGPDKNFYDIQKVSSMGNGFTFELMTLILCAVGRILDPDYSVYGDDIIISNKHARDHIHDLESVGFVVGASKSFIDSPFRESCGANFHDDHGYIESYDFLFPENIHDCAVLYQKAQRLSRIYPSFKPMEEGLRRVTPKALRGPRQEVAAPSAPFEPFFTCGHSRDCLVDGRLKGGLLRVLRDEFHYPEDEKFVLFYGWSFKPEERSRSPQQLSGRRHWAKYLMYLHSGRRSDDLLEGRGTWERHLRIGNGLSSWRVKDLIRLANASAT